MKDYYLDLHSAISLHLRQIDLLSPARFLNVSSFRAFVPWRFCARRWMIHARLSGSGGCSGVGKQLLELAFNVFQPCDVFRSVSACSTAAERCTGPTHLKLLELEWRARPYQAEINAKCFASSQLRQLDMRRASLA